MSAVSVRMAANIAKHSGIGALIGLSAAMAWKVTVMDGCHTKINNFHRKEVIKLKKGEL